MSRTRFILGLSLALSAGVAASAEIGTGWEIVVPDPAPRGSTNGIPRMLEFMGQKLSAAFREGARLEVPCVRASSRKAKGPAIFIGAEFAHDAGFDLSGLRDMDNVIAEKDGSVYLFGNDHPSALPSRTWTRNVLPSAKAVTSFMERFMSVRFLMPGDVGTDIPRIDSVVIPDGFCRTERPRLHMTVADQVCRSFEPMPYALANSLYGFGTFWLYGGHAYGLALPVEKYGKDHPEYYALCAGRRVMKKSDPALCISNPEVADILVDYLVRMFDEKGVDAIEFGQNDGRGFCECEKCAAYGKGLGYSEQFWRFHRDIAERVYRIRPNKRLLLTCYGPTYVLPKTFTEFPPNVMVEVMDYSDRAFENWRRYKVPCGFTAYIYEWGWYRTPGFTPKWTSSAAAAEARRFAANGIKGIYYCGDCFHSGMEGPTVYAFQRLLENPEDDVNRLIDEFCTRSYGNAARQMMAFHRLIDRQVEMFVAMHEHNSRPQNAIGLFSVLYPPDTLMKLEGYLSRSERMDLTEKQAKRLRLVRLEFDYLNNLVRACHRYNAYLVDPSKETFEPLAKLVEERNAMIDSFYDEKGVMKPLDWWPGLRLFACPPKARMLTNGRQTATLSSPFNWDVAYMREKGILPGRAAKSLTVRRVRRRPTAAELAAGTDYPGEWQALGGLQMEQIRNSTRFKVLYDERNLYVAVSATLDDAVRVKPVGPDGFAAGQECLELFLDPFGQRESHFHLVWNPIEDSRYDAAAGFITDTLDPLYGLPDPKWNGKWSYETLRKDGMWYSVATVPFAVLGVAPAQSGDVWTMNLGRESKFPDIELELALWSPNLESRLFGSREAFGRATFE